MFDSLRKKPVPPPALSGGWQRALYGLGVLVGLAILSPVALLALTTVTSIAMAIVVAVGIMAMLIALPALNRWWRIIVLKMLKASARRNPVETLQLELLNRQGAFERAGRVVVQIKGLRDSLREQLDEYKGKHGESDAGLEKNYDTLSRLTDRLTASLRQTSLNLEKFQKFVERQADRWEIAKKSGELAAMLRQAQGGDVTDVFLANTAIDTIRTELNTSFAELDQILAHEEVRQLTSGSPDQLIDVTPTVTGITETEMIGRAV